jgi:plasmid maintenance system antidote protein VapI
MRGTNYAVPPGAYLQEWMEERGMSQQEAAEGLMYSREHVNRIIAGKVTVGNATARRLEFLTGIPQRTWIRHELGFRDDLERLQRDRMQNALLIREAEASTRMDRNGQDGTFGLGPQDVITFSKEALYQALRATVADLDYDLLKALEHPEDEDDQNLGDVTEEFLKRLKEE